MGGGGGGGEGGLTGNPVLGDKDGEKPVINRMEAVLSTTF